MEFMFDFDGDGDIDEFDEDLAEYELQMMEDEMLFEEEERRQIHGAGKEEDWRNKRKKNFLDKRALAVKFSKGNFVEGLDAVKLAKLLEISFF